MPSTPAMISEKLEEFIRLYDSQQTSLLLPEDLEAIDRNIHAWVAESDVNELARTLRCYPTVEAVTNQVLALTKEIYSQL